MKPADFGYLVAICFMWAANLVLTRWTVTVGGVPPLFFAAVRVTLLAGVLAPFLLPAPRQLATMFVIAMGMAGLQFGLLFLGLNASTASVAAVVGQLGVPFTTILSIVFLGEQVGVYRTMGMLLAFAGVMIIVVDPAEFSLGIGVVYLTGAALTGAIGNILMKRIDPMPALRLQAWVGLFSIVPLCLMSWAWERGQADAYIAGDWQVYASSIFAVVGVSIFAHGGFYRLIKKYDVTLLSPLTLMTPVIAVVLGVVLLGEHVTWQMLLGGAIALAGVGIIGMRRNRRFPEAAVGDKIGP